MDQKTAHENRRNAFAGDAERERRNERAAGNRVVRRFGAGNSFDASVPERFFMLRCTPRFVVAEERRNRRARSREDTDDVADNPRAQNRRRDQFHLLTVEEDAVVELDQFSGFTDFVIGEHEDLRHRKETDERRGKGESFIQGRLSERKAEHAVHRIHADRRQQKTERAGDEPLYHGVGADAGDDRQTENRKPKIFRASESHREFCKRRRKKVKGNAA